MQYEKTSPIWGYQRDLTKVNNPDGYSPQYVSNDFLVLLPAANNRYAMMDPNRCANVAGQFDGTVLGTRPTGQACGSVYGTGYKTIKNGKESGQIYSSATFDVNDNFQLFGDALYSLEEVKYATGSGYTWWGTSSGWGRFYDQASGQYMNLQRVFAPEDIGGGGYRDIMNTDRNKAYQVTLGGRGTAGNWDYSLSFTRGEYKLTERNFVRWNDPINDYFEQRVLGPVLVPPAPATSTARTGKRSTHRCPPVTSRASPATATAKAAPGRTWPAPRSPMARCSLPVAMPASPWFWKAAVKAGITRPTRA